MKTLILSVTLLVAAAAQDPRPQMKCEDHNWRGARTCEIREQTVGYGGLLDIDGRRNGGISVTGWNRQDVLVRAKVEAWADTDSEAKSIASQVRISSGAGKVTATGPSLGDHEPWSVSYEVFAPLQSNLELKAHNGGIHISDIRGNIHFETNNGGVHLARVNGSVKGQTTNGGVHVQLAGSRWEGSGMDVSTTNGGVHIEAPANYSAQLETSTVNGGVKSDFGNPANRKDRELRMQLGSGGAPLRVTTRNGGVHVNRT